MRAMTQPVKGVVATALVVTAALAFCVALAPDVLGSWGTAIPVAMVPAQMVLTLLWRCEVPGAVAVWPQPWRGFALLALNVVMGLVVAWFAWHTIGGHMSPPPPFVNMYLILAVPTTMWLIIVFQGWPFTAWFKQPAVAGIALWLSAYVLAYLIYRALFNFGFLQSAPFYRVELDPAGRWMAWTPLVASIVTAVAMLCMVLLDCWPVTWLARRLPASGRQPLFGLLVGGCVVVISVILWQVGVVALGMDLVVFLVQVCVSMAFGTFILLVTMEGVPSVAWQQPWRGLALIAVAAVGAMLVFGLYRGVAVACWGLAAGAPGYVLELWIASAMLAITFPLMVLFANVFGFWPLLRIRAVDAGSIDAADGVGAPQTRQA